MPGTKMEVRLKPFLVIPYLERKGWALVQWQESSTQCNMLWVWVLELGSLKKKMGNAAYQWPLLDLAEVSFCIGYANFFLSNSERNFYSMPWVAPSGVDKFSQ